MDLLSAAVANNAAWCSLVSPDGGRVTDDGVWLASGPPPPLFPDAVTMRPSVSAAAVAALLPAHRACSVKDSFADVELGPFGPTVLFTAQWIACIPPVGAVSPMWSCVTEPAELADWCAAAELPAQLPADLLQDTSVRVLARRRGHRVVAGAIANVTAGVVGLSNVFGIGTPWGWAELPGVVAGYFADRPIVGYEHSDELDAAVAGGFAILGPLRVWIRPAVQE